MVRSLFQTVRDKTDIQCGNEGKRERLFTTLSNIYFLGLKHPLISYLTVYILEFRIMHLTNHAVAPRTLNVEEGSRKPEQVEMASGIYRLNTEENYRDIVICHVVTLSLET